MSLCGLVACGNAVVADPWAEPAPDDGPEVIDAEPSTQTPQQPAVADTDPAPKPEVPNVPPPPPLVVLIHTSHGTAFDNWLRSTGEDDFELGPELAVLGAYRDRMLVLDGFDGYTAQDAGVGAYDWGPSLVFTGDNYVAPGTYGDFHRHYRPGRPSLERYLDGDVPFRSIALAFVQPLDLGPSPEGFGTFYVAAAKRDEPIRPGSDVRAEHTRIFSGVTSTIPEWSDRLSALSDWVTSANLDDPEVRASGHAKLIAMALGSGMTRGIVYQASTVYERFGTIGINELAHWTTPEERVAHDAARMVVARRIATVVDELAVTPHYAGGSVLDHTLVVWVDDTGFAALPAAHSPRRLPIVWIGGLGGRIATGRYVRTPTNRPYVDMLRTLAEALELDPLALGEPFATATSIQGVLR